MIIHKLKGFGIDSNHGNIAYVIENNQLNDIEKQIYAKEQNLPVCVFIEEIADNHVTVDFYYPHRQSPMCLHGSLALSKVIFGKYPYLSSFVIKTKSQREILTNKINGKINLNVHQENLVQPEIKLSEISQLLKIPLDKIINTPTLVSVGSPKLLVEVADQEILFYLSPELEKINEWSKVTKINGIYAFSQFKDIIHARNFNHLDPKLEDSATGVSAGALCAFFKKDLTVRQGFNLDNPCQINTIYTSTMISISGNIGYL